MYGIIDCKKPIIALVNGAAIGIGATILPYCDLVIATDKAYFYTPFPLIGMVPEFASSYTFPKVMGTTKVFFNTHRIKNNQINNIKICNIFN